MLSACGFFVCHGLTEPSSFFSVYRLRTRIRQLYNKVSERKRDASCQLALEMCKTASTIIHPDFKVKPLTGRGKGIKRWRQELLDWGHYQYKQRLIQAAQRTNTVLVLGKEPFTTVTCSACHRFGSCTIDRVFQCPHCGLVSGRDVNGGTNNGVVMMC